MREWLKDARQKAGLTQAELAKDLGITESYYSYIERGARQKSLDLTLVIKLARFLCLTTSQIVEYEEGAKLEMAEMNEESE